MKIQVFGDGSPIHEIDTGESLQLSDYKRLASALGMERKPAHEVRQLLAELESKEAASGDGAEPIDRDMLVVTIAARWAMLHSDEELQIRLEPSTRLDLILAAIEAAVPGAEVQLL